MRLGWRAKAAIPPLCLVLQRGMDGVGMLL